MDACLVRVGVLGGTFDPPHVGHLRLAEAAYEQMQLERVVFVPAGDPYRKATRAVTLPEIRLALVRAAVAHLPWAEVSDIEVRRSGPSYTDETLSSLARGGGEWWFIIGADVLVDLPHWRAPRRIVELARLAVAVRPPMAMRVPRETSRAIPGIEGRVDWLEMKPIDVSSTEIRRRIRAGESTEPWLSPRVRALIDEFGLYRAPDGARDS